MSVWKASSQRSTQPPTKGKMQTGKFTGIVRRIAIFPFVVLIRFYQTCISPLTPAACRFTPTCSQYALEAFRRHGIFKGFYLAVKRILRCHPWGGHGYDPVPEKFVVFSKNNSFTSYNSKNNNKNNTSDNHNKTK